MKKLLILSITTILLFVSGCSKKESEVTFIDTNPEGVEQEDSPETIDEFIISADLTGVDFTKVSFNWKNTILLKLMKILKLSCFRLI